VAWVDGLGTTTSPVLTQMVSEGENIQVRTVQKGLDRKKSIFLMTKNTTFRVVNVFK
jgi:hypothetical protein